MDAVLADYVAAARDDAALRRGQGNEQAARESEAEADRVAAMISAEYQNHVWNPSEDRIRVLERSTLTREVREGPDYAERLLDAGGFTRGAPTNPWAHDYARYAADSAEALGAAATAQDATSGMKEIELKHDLWVYQYFDPARPLDHEDGRSHEFWTPVDPADVPDLPDLHPVIPGRVDPDPWVVKTEEFNALLPSWADRTHVQVALIPAGTVINVGETRPQAEKKELTEKLRWATDASGSLRPEFEPRRILGNTIPYVRIGGGDEIRFDRFDDGWIKGWALVH